MAGSTSKGKALQDMLLTHIHAFKQGPALADRERAIIYGVTSGGMIPVKVLGILFSCLRC